MSNKGKDYMTDNNNSYHNSSDHNTSDKPKRGSSTRNPITKITQITSNPNPMMTRNMKL